MCQTSETKNVAGRVQNSALARRAGEDAASNEAIHALFEARSVIATAF